MKNLKAKLGGAGIRTLMLAAPFGLALLMSWMLSPTDHALLTPRADIVLVEEAKIRVVVGVAPEAERPEAKGGARAPRGELTTAIDACRPKPLRELFKVSPPLRCYEYVFDGAEALDYGLSGEAAFLLMAVTIDNADVGGVQPPSTALRRPGPRAIPLRATEPAQSARGVTPPRYPHVDLPPEAQVYTLGNLSEALAQTLAEHDVSLANAILYLLALMAMASGFAFLMIELKLRGQRYDGESLQRALDTVHDEVNRLQREVQPPDVDRLANQRVHLESLVAHKDNHTPVWLADILRASLRHYTVAHRLPSEVFTEYAEAAELDHANLVEGAHWWWALMSWSALLAPTLGFAGTLLGMTKAFGTMSAAGMSTEGIASAMMVAMITTLVGLVVRVQALTSTSINEQSWDRTFAKLRSTGRRWCQIYEMCLYDRRGGAFDAPRGG